MKVRGHIKGAIRNSTIRVVLVDDHTILREGLRLLLDAAPDIQVVGEAANGIDAITTAAQCTPDVVVMDLNMPGGDGVTATLELSRLERPPKVLILTMYTEEERLIPLLQGGASGFLSKDTAERELIEAIRVVASGDVFVRPSVARLLATNARSHTQHSTLDEARDRFNTLSPRERTVLHRIAEGYSGVEIGRLLGVTPKTIDTYRNRVGEKLGLAHRTDFVRCALRLGLLGAAESESITDSQMVAPTVAGEVEQPRWPETHRRIRC